MDKLPEKIIELDQVRINRNLDKECVCERRKFVIDTTNKRILCSSCGVVIDPYDAMQELALKGEGMKKYVEDLLEQRKQIENYKPHLLTIRSLEKNYRGKKKLPCCPRCDEPFYLEELRRWMGKPFADARIERWKEENEE